MEAGIGKWGNFFNWSVNASEFLSEAQKRVGTKKHCPF